VKVLAVCESPPTLDTHHGNGSTLISHHVLSRLPGSLELDLLWFADRAAEPSAEVLARASHVERLAVRPRALALPAMPFTSLPTATWQRSSPAALRSVVALAHDADVVYLHGLHTFAVADTVDAPIVANEIDPWSLYWAERARSRRGASAAYDRVQSRRARDLERRIARRAGALVVVNEADARLLEADTGAQVHAVPNGLDAPVPARDVGNQVDGPDPLRCVFAGTLDYPPNVAAARKLVADVWPQLRARVPDARLVIAGRRPTEQVLALSDAASGVEVMADVADLASIVATSAVAIYPGDFGRGTKNTVAEALALGCPVVASPSARRGLEDGPYLREGGDPAALAAAAAAWLLDPVGRAAAGRSGREAMGRRPTWDDVAARYADLLGAAVADPRGGRHR
jgi:glycosyltransferase involved in cell wall biosynthesis